MCNFYDLRQRHCVFCIFPHALLDGKKNPKQPQHPLHKLVPTHEPSNCLVKNYNAHVFLRKSDTFNEPR